MTRADSRPPTSRSHRTDWRHVHRVGQDPPGNPSPGPGPTGPGPSGPGGSSGPGRAGWGPPQPPPPPPPDPPLPPRYDDRLMALANPGMAIYPGTRRGPEDPILLPPRPPAAGPQPLPPPPPLPQPPDPPWPQPTAARQPSEGVPGDTHPSPSRPRDTRPPSGPKTPDPTAPAPPTATDGDGQIGGRGHCRRMALLLLPVLPLLLPILFLAGLLLARPKPGHPIGPGDRTRGNGQGSWDYTRPADTDPEPPGRHPRGIRSNLDPGEDPAR